MLKIRTKVAAAVAAVSLAVIGGGAAYAATQPGSQFQQVACVKFGTPGSANGNVMLYDYNDSACPAGTYRVKLDQPEPVVTVTQTVKPSPSVSASSSVTGTPVS